MDHTIKNYIMREIGLALREGRPLQSLDFVTKVWWNTGDSIVITCDEGFQVTLTLTAATPAEASL